MAKGITLEQFKTAMHAHQIKNKGANPRVEELPKFLNQSAELAQKRRQRMKDGRLRRVFGW